VKVLVFTSLYPNNVWPERGVFIRERVRHYARAGDCDVKVVAPVPYAPRMLVGRYGSFSQVRRREMVDGLEVIHPRYILIPKVGMTVHGWMMYRSVLPSVREIRRDFDFDLVDAHFVYPDGFAAARLARYFGRPLVVSARGSDINLFRTFPFIRRQIQTTLAAAAGVIAVSSALQDAMVELGTPRDSIAVIPNGVDSARFHPMPRQGARATLGLPPGPMILCVGNLSANKGFHLVVDAVASLAAEEGMQDLHLAIVGEGPFRAELARTIQARGITDRVRLVGHTPHDALRLWYGAADAFCLASAMEGMPNAVLEALACGVPVVATAAGGIPEIITSEQIGILSERNSHALALALGTALRRDWDRAKIAEFARQRTWDRTAADVLRVFENVLARRRT
jgi:teichuronic acid biosynthesis glycosyltransferase TuaC